MTFKLNNIHKAVNWNVEDDDFTQAFWDQNVKQFWLPEEISISKENFIAQHFHYANTIYHTNYGIFQLCHQNQHNRIRRTN